jgi:hypothetical protein
VTGASRVLVALRVPVPAERAFAAFTEQIAEWWQPNGLFQFTDGRTGTLAFEPGPDGRLVETEWRWWFRGWPGDLVEGGGACRRVTCWGCEAGAELDGCREVGSPVD